MGGGHIVMGFQQAAKYYYMPSFRQPPTYHELIVNKKKWDKLPNAKATEDLASKK
jgi:TRAP-type mannitol/chloroaromatic compound transport system substrate-binding protein